MKKNAIKEYTHVDKNNKDVKFRISRIEEFYTQRATEPESPHKHDFYTILLTNKAKGTHLIDFNSYELGDNQIYFIGLKLRRALNPCLAKSSSNICSI